MNPLGKQAADTQRCAFCGKYMAAHLRQCPFCREVPFQLPVLILPLVTDYLSPLLFLGGLGMTIYGLFLRIKS